MSLQKRICHTIPNQQPKNKKEKKARRRSHTTRRWRCCTQKHTGTMAGAREPDTYVRPHALTQDAAARRPQTHSSRRRAQSVDAVEALVPQPPPSWEEADHPPPRH
uniref:Uncharacterized protein n=1 Tax=Arundo donax TaxID=35708 RepID=A0A0A9D7R7_ARUDO